MLVQFLFLVKNKRYVFVVNLYTMQCYNSDHYNDLLGCLAYFFCSNIIILCNCQTLTCIIGNFSQRLFFSHFCTRLHSFFVAVIRYNASTLSVNIVINIVFTNIKLTISVFFVCFTTRNCIFTHICNP